MQPVVDRFPVYDGGSATACFVMMIRKCRGGTGIKTASEWKHPEEISDAYCAAENSSCAGAQKCRGGTGIKTASEWKRPEEISDAYCAAENSSCAG
ncbi:MAG: hypothetical protein NC420_05895, partial [Eubacterium sp.]|nr:hypothetical protein [Eubacterium sp.]